MQGTIVEVTVAGNDTLEAVQLVVVLEAMKMEQPLNAHKDAAISSLAASVGAAVASGAAIAELRD